MPPVDDDEENARRRSYHNTHRSLRQLVALEAWFRQSDKDPRCHTLHANVTFDEERLGTGEDVNLTFRLAVKKCEVVFLTPSSGYFVVDPSTVRSPKPLKPHELEIRKMTSNKLGAGIAMRFAGWRSPISGDAEASARREASRTVSSSQQVSAYHEISKRSHEGYRAWSLDGRDFPEQRLLGPVWDAEQEPRLSVIDKRPEAVAQRDTDMGFPPCSRIEVRCLREDIDIYDIQFKDPAEDRKLRRRSGQENRMKSAEAFLKVQIERGGLRMPSLSDRFSELTILDATIPIINTGDFDR